MPIYVTLVGVSKVNKGRLSVHGWGFVRNRQILRSFG